MKILLTGATGVVGRRVVPLLLEAGHDVTGVVHSRSGRAELAHQGVTTLDLDLFDAEAARRALDGHEAVVNLATRIPRSPLQMFLPWAWRENDRLRRVASATLVGAAAAVGVPRFVQESFAPVYPDCADRWIDETERLAPVRYNRTVVDAEAAAARYSEGGGTGVILRFGGFYGPDAFQTIAMIDAVRRGWAPLPGPPDAFISSIAHDDAASAVVAAVMLPAGAYNVVDNVPVTHREFFDSLAEVLGVRSPRLPPQWLTPLFGSLGEMAARSLRISNRKLRRASDWVPTCSSIRQGWQSVIEQLHSKDASAQQAPA
jgi:nucleoside-diphosphate-sugar epimerase